MDKQDLSTWIRSGVVEKNLKDTFKSTLNALYDACPLRKSRESIRDSLHNLLYNDKTFRQSSPAHITMLGWFEDERITRETFPPVEHSFSFSEEEQGATIPPIEHSFSFSGEEQATIIKNLINLVEKAFHDFLVRNENIIPLDFVKSFADRQQLRISKDFRDADLLCMLGFILENATIFSEKYVFHGHYKDNPAELLINFDESMRSELVHGIVIGEEGRWNDYALQHVATLACEVIICLDGNYKEVFANKVSIDNEIIKRWTDKTSRKRKSEIVVDNKGENVNPKKRKLDNVLDDNSDLEKLVELVLNIFEDLEETDKKDGKKILKLAIDENEYVTKYWKMIKAEERKTQARKFIQYANAMFDVNLKIGSENRR